MSDLVIHYAAYGMKNHKRDVIDILQSRISENDRLNVLVCKKTFGDHYPGESKELWVIYTFNGILHNDTVKEHEVFSIPRFTPEHKDKKMKFGKFEITPFGLMVIAFIVYAFITVATK